MTTKRLIWLGIAVALAVGLSIAASLDRDERAAQKAALNQAIAEADPAKAAVALWPGSNHQTTASLNRSRQHLTVVFSLDPILTVNSARRNVFRASETLIPELFATFPDLRTIELKALATFTAINGQQRIDNAAILEFQRATAAQIVWANIKPENTPRLADYSWMHPAFQKDE
jgi:hypothetical protein